MSLFSDYEAEIEFAKDFLFGVPCDTWRSKSGEIKVTEITDAHIANCMRIVGEDDPWYGRFQEELNRRQTKSLKLKDIIPYLDTENELISVKYGSRWIDMEHISEYMESFVESISGYEYNEIWIYLVKKEEEHEA